MNTTKDVWARVERRGPTECWKWTGYISPDGYGHICINYKDWPAHRAAYVDIYGPVSPVISVLHLCSNRRCCNPAHLKAGTGTENQQQAVREGVRKAGISGIVGVRYDKSRARWIASARFDGIRYNLYQGRDLFEACCARKSWEVHRDGKNA